MSMPTSISTSLATSQSRKHALLEANLAALGQLNAVFAEKVRSADGIADNISFVETQQGVPTVIVDNKPLASKHRPLDEAKRLVDKLELIDHAVFVALGFGAGYHIAELAQRLSKTGVIVIFEPDLELLRAMFERIDMRKWLSKAIIIWLHDPADRAAVSTALSGAESIIAQGVQFIDHSANRQRLGKDGNDFAQMLSDYVNTAKTTLLTTLVRAADTIRNLLGNVDHYALGPGVLPLKNAATDRTAFVVSAGPSLRKNIEQLAQPSVREHCIIIAVQTVLKPLLAAGIKPHFVTSLDYHEISKRFYEGLSRDDVEGITLVADAKAHPVILDSFPGMVRCCEATFLDELLGNESRDMGKLSNGATVAHLAFYLAEYLGCSTIAMIGQDLGFTDGLYYSPGTAIHDVWGPELNQFNTIEMMEWQRIVRHRVHLHERQDQHGRTIFTDTQMLTYLQQFERDFAKAADAGVKVIDASEGGVQKQHTQSQPLEDVLTQALERSTRPHKIESFAKGGVLTPCQQNGRRAHVRSQLLNVQSRLSRLEDVSRRTQKLLITMLQMQLDQDKMNRHFERLQKLREQAETMHETMHLLNHLNQLGVFKRQLSDRKLHLSKSLSAFDRQRAHFERDIENVRWTADAAAEMQSMLNDAIVTLTYGSRIDVINNAERKSQQRSIENFVATGDTSADVSTKLPRVGGLIAVDLQWQPHILEKSHRELTVYEATLQRLAQSNLLNGIVVIVSEQDALKLPVLQDELAKIVEVRTLPQSPFGREHSAIRAARAWSRASWRSGIAGMSVYDEILCPAAMFGMMQEHNFDAAVIVGADWCVVDVSRDNGVDGLIERFREHPDRHNLVFTQSPPGLNGCLISRTLMEELTLSNRLSTIGGLLTYQPHAPQADPIARDANVQISHDIRQSLIRATADEASLRELQQQQALPTNASAVVQLIESKMQPPIEHFTIELTTKREDIGIFAQRLQRKCSPHAEMSGQTFDATLASIAKLHRNPAITLAGRGDSLLHPHCFDFINRLKAVGVQHIHLRTALRCDEQTLQQLIEHVEVVSVDLNADRASTYATMMGDDHFRKVIENIDWLVEHRTRLTDHPAKVAFALPWIVPRIQRCAETFEDINSFYDRWQAALGWAMIDSLPTGCEDALTATWPPPHVVENREKTSRFIRADGCVFPGDHSQDQSKSVAKVADITW